MIFKVCPSCNNEKHFSEFHRDKYRKGGLASSCKQCRNLRSRKWYRSIGSKIKNRHKQKALYGLSIDEYETLIVKQNNRCAICGNKETSKKHLSIDHNHTTGQVRGLLCFRCNTAIGLMNEDKCVLNKAIKYLDRFNGV